MPAGYGNAVRTVTPRPAPAPAGGGASPSPGIFTPSFPLTPKVVKPRVTAPNQAPFKPGHAPAQIGQSGSRVGFDQNVAALQSQLRAMGYDIAVDGVLGPRTTEALYLSKNASVPNRLPYKPPQVQPVVQELRSTPTAQGRAGIIKTQFTEPHQPTPPKFVPQAVTQGGQAITPSALLAAEQVEREKHPDLIGSPNVIRQLAVHRLTGGEATAPPLTSLLGSTSEAGQQAELAKYKFENEGGIGGTILRGLINPLIAATGANIVAKLNNGEAIHPGDILSTVTNAALTSTGMEAARSIIGGAEAASTARMSEAAIADAIRVKQANGFLPRDPISISHPARTLLEQALHATPGISPEEVPHIMAVADHMAAGVAEARGIPAQDVYGQILAHAEFIDSAPRASDIGTAAAQIDKMHETPAERVTANVKQKLNPKNADKGLPQHDIVAPTSGIRMFGRPSMNEWVDRVLKYTPDIGQRQKDAAWYDLLEPAFKEAFGRNEVQPLLRGFLASQANAGPADGLASALLAMERMDRLAPIHGVDGGIGSVVAKEIAQAIKGDVLTSGQAGKLSDFIDSARGKARRTWMGNHADAGAPAAGDIWSGRDVGYVDTKIASESNRGRGATLRKHVREEHGVDMSKLTPEYNGSLSGNRYERVSEFYNELADHLNKTHFDGRSDWKPREAQALGWMNMQRVYGRTPQEIEEWVASAIDKFQRAAKRNRTVEATRHIDSPKGVHLLGGARKDIMEQPGHPGYLYHGTDAEGAHGIMTSGRIEARPTERNPEENAAWLTAHPARAAAQGDHVIAIPRGNVEHQLNSHALGMYSSPEDVHIHGNPLDESTAMVHSEAIPEASLHPVSNEFYNRLDWQHKAEYAAAVDKAITDGHFERVVGLQPRGSHYGVGVWRGEPNPGIATHYGVTQLGIEEEKQLNALSAAQGMAKEQGSVSWGRPLPATANSGDNVFPAVMGQAPSNPATMAKLGALADQKFGDGMIGVIHGPGNTVYLVDFHGETADFANQMRDLLGSDVHEMKWQGGYTIDERLKTEPWEKTFQQAIKESPNSKELKAAVDHVHGVVREIQQNLFSKTPATAKYEGMLRTFLAQHGYNTEGRNLTAPEREYAEESLHQWAKDNPQSPYSGQFLDLHQAHVAEHNAASPESYFGHDNPLMGSIAKAQGVRRFLKQEWTPADDVGRFHHELMTDIGKRAQDMQSKVAGMGHVYGKGDVVTTKSGKQFEILGRREVKGETGYAVRQIGGGAQHGAQYTIPESAIDHFAGRPDWLTQKGDLANFMNWDGVGAAKDELGTAVRQFPSDVKDTVGEIFGRSKPASEKVENPLVKGATAKLDSGKSALFLFRNADASTALHELAHVMEDHLPTELRKQIKDPEHFARSFERYIADGKAPSPELQQHFDSLAVSLSDVYGAAANVPGADLTGPLKTQLDRFFTRQAQHDPEFAARTGASWFAQESSPYKITDEQHGLTKTFLHNGHETNIGKTESAMSGEGTQHFHLHATDEQGNLVGAMHGTLQPEKNNLHLASVYVPEEHRGKGISTALHNTARNYAEKNGLSLSADFQNPELGAQQIAQSLREGRPVTTNDFARTFFQKDEGYTPSRSIAYHDLLVHPRPARSTVSRAVVDKPWDSVSTKLEHVATRLRESSSPLAKKAGKALTPFTTRSRVPRIAARNFNEDMGRVAAGSHSAMHTLTSLDTRLGLHALRPGEGEGLSHYWWAQLPESHRNAEGLKLLRDSLMKEHEYVSNPDGAFKDLKDELLDLEENRPTGDDVTASDVFAHLSEEAKVKQEIADLPDTIAALQRNIVKLEHVVRKTPEYNPDAISAIRQLMDERTGILMNAGVLDPKVASARTSLVADHLGLEPDGSEIYVGHRAGDLSRGASFPRGASFGGTRTPRGAARGHQNQLILFKHGMLQQSMESIIKDWSAAQGYQFAIRAKNDLSKMGEPVLGYLKKDHILVNPQGQRVPRAIHVDPEKQAEAEGLNVSDLTELHHNFFAETTEEQQRMIEEAKKMGNLHELRQVPKDVAAKYYEAILGKRAAVSTPGIRPEGIGHSLGKGMDVVTNGVYMSLIYTNPGYIPSILMQNMVMAGLHQGAFLPLNLARAGELLATGDKRVADYIKGEVGVGALESIAAGKSSNVTHNFIRHIHTVPDTWPRTAAFLHEAARQGIISRFGRLSPADNKALLDLFENPAKLEKLREVANYARQSQVDFTRLRPTEQALARRLLFVWPWIRGISAYPGRFVLDHPGRSLALAAYIGAGSQGKVPFPKLVTKDVPTWLQDSISTGDKVIQGKEYPTVFSTRYLNPAATTMDLYQTLTGAPGAAVINSLLNPIIGTAWHIGNKEDRFGHAAPSYRAAFLSGLESLVPNYGLGKDLVHPPDLQHSGLYPGDTTRLGRIERALRVFPFPYDPTQALKDSEAQGLQGNLQHVHDKRLLDDAKRAGFGDVPKGILIQLDHKTALDHIGSTHKGDPQGALKATVKYYTKATGRHDFDTVLSKKLPDSVAETVYHEIRQVLIGSGLSAYESAIKTALQAKGEKP